MNQFTVEISLAKIIGPGTVVVILVLGLTDFGVKISNHNGLYYPGRKMPRPRRQEVMMSVRRLGLK